MSVASGKKQGVAKTSRGSRASLGRTVQRRNIPKIAREAGNKSTPNESLDIADSTEAAEFIGDFLVELKNQAKGANLHFLAYLLHLAREEARDITQRPSAATEET